MGSAKIMNAYEIDGRFRHRPRSALQPVGPWASTSGRSGSDGFTWFAFSHAAEKGKHCHMRCAASGSPNE